MFTFHPLIHALHHDGDKDDAEHCPLCRFVTALGFILLCVFLLILGIQQAQFNSPELRLSLPFKSLSPHYGRAPPVLS